jgi:glycerophosphoryl diester phosphodiesterase
VTPPSTVVRARRPDAGRDRPLVLAHRSGNDLAALRSAEALGVDVVEADVHLFRGRLEVRHLKTVGPLRIYWDRWRLAGPGAVGLDLDALLDAARPTTELMLDLKGFDRRVAAAVLEALDRHPGARVTLCSRHWGHLTPFEGRPGVRLVRSVGNRPQLRAVLRHLSARPLDGVCIHRRLLTPGLVAELRGTVPFVMTWPVNTREAAVRLAGWGVNGLISDHPRVLGAAAHS